MYKANEMNGNYVIAGGSKGIGHALVKLLKSTATRVDVLSRDRDELEFETAADRVRHIPCDFREDEAIVGLPDVIHGAVYCPGSIKLRSFRNLKVDDFREDLEINLLGAVRFLQACYPGLKAGGAQACSSVVLFSTVAVQLGLSMHASVAAAKGAVEGLARSLAAEWAPYVRVNCVAPALTETSLSARFFSSPESRAGLAAKYPLARTGEPQDLASIAAFLLSQESSWITGQTIGIDGGLSTLGSVSKP